MAMSWEEWGATVAAIRGASIARQVHDMIESGRGAPSADDMRRFAEEAEAIVELWTDVAGADGK